MATLQASEKPFRQLVVKVLGGDIKDKGLGRPDPYVKLRIIPGALDGRRQVRTSTAHNTTNPEWNEEFKFFLDPDVENTHLEITLMESDSWLLKDDYKGTTKCNLSQLQLNQSYQESSLFEEGSKIDLEMKLENCSEASVMRFSMELCEQEKDFLEKRKDVVFTAMRKVLDGDDRPQHRKEVPIVAVIGSGGGLRAAISISGVFCALQKMGLLDCVTYASGVSGSTWYLSHLYSSPKWPAEVHVDEIREQLRENVNKTWLLKTLFNPSWIFKVLGFIGEKKEQGQPVCITDLLGCIIRDTIMVDRKGIPKLSEQQRAVKDAKVPLPLYTCVYVKKKVSAVEYCEWVEFTPYEVAMPTFGTSVDTKYFGCQFYGGKLLKTFEEPPLHYLQGLWGSAHARYLERVFNHGQDDTDDDADDTDDDDDEESDSEEEPNIEDTSSFSFTGFFKEMFDKLLRTRVGAGTVHNFLRGLQVPPHGEAAHDHLLKPKRIILADSGHSINSPYPPLLRPQRAVDIFLSFDFSARDNDDQPLFEQLLKAEAWAKKSNLKFPPIDAEAQYKKHGKKEFYVFCDEADPECPIVMHFPLVNKSFRDHHHPTASQPDDFADFSLFEDPGVDPFRSFQLHYPHKDFDRLASLSEFNTGLGKTEIKEVMARVVRRKRERRLVASHTYP